jgi:hypothetical protein
LVKVNTLELTALVVAPLKPAAGVDDVQAEPLDVNTLPAVPGEGKELNPVPPDAAGSGFVNETTCEPLIVIAVVSPVWISSEFELSPVDISPPGDVVVLLIIDAIMYSPLLRL